MSTPSQPRQVPQPRRCTLPQARPAAGGRRASGRPGLESPGREGAPPTVLYILRENPSKVAVQAPHTGSSRADPSHFTPGGARWSRFCKEGAKWGGVAREGAGPPARSRELTPTSAVLLSGRREAWAWRRARWLGPAEGFQVRTEGPCVRGQAQSDPRCKKPSPTLQRRPASSTC